MRHRLLSPAVKIKVLHEPITSQLSLPAANTEGEHPALATYMPKIPAGSYFCHRWKPCTSRPASEQCSALIKAHSTACQHTSCPVLSTWCFTLVLLGAAPHATFDSKLSPHLDMLVLLYLQISFSRGKSSNLCTEFVMQKKRQMVVKLIFTIDFSRDLCLSAYYESKSSSTVHGQPLSYQLSSS